MKGFLVLVAVIIATATKQACGKRGKVTIFDRPWLSKSLAHAQRF